MKIHVFFLTKRGYNSRRLCHRVIDKYIENGGNRMKGHMNTDMGKVIISPEVIATYAGSVAVECFGIVGMGAISMKDGIVKLLKKEKITRGINVTVEEDQLTLDFHIIIAYGVNISTVTDNLIETVKYKVEEFTGLTLDKINIYVDGVRVID